jgi:hypothetical protein
LPIDGLIWFGLTLLALTVLRRLLHREIQSGLLILTRSREFTITIFSLLFLPGVLLHELSHYLAALILRVPSADFSLAPRVLPDGGLRLGYVETQQTDILRDSLIGAAPLVTGGLVVAFLAMHSLNLAPLLQEIRSGGLGEFWAGLAALPSVRDFPLLFYLLFTVSSTMLPSQSDRHAWVPLAAVAAAFMGLAALAGDGPWMISNLAPLLNSFLAATAVVFGVSAGLHALLLFPAAAIHLGLARLTGTDVS